MAFFVKIKAIILKKKANKVVQDKQAVQAAPTRTAAKYATLIALATGAQGINAEDIFPRILQQAVHHNTVIRIRTPISHGVLAGWLHAMLAEGSARLSDLNRVLGIGSSDNEASDVVDISCAVAHQVVVYEEATECTSTIAEVEDEISVDVTISVEVYDEDSPACDALVVRNDGDADASMTSQAVVPSSHLGLPQMLHNISTATLVEERLLAPDASTVPKLSLSIHDFTITRQLGQGGFGVVHLVKHNDTGVCAALKVIPKERKQMEDADATQVAVNGQQQSSTAASQEVSGDAEIEDGQEAAMRFGSVLKEQRALKRVKGTAGMLEILASFHDTTNFYIVTSYYPGGDLQSRIDTSGRFSESVACFYGAQMLLGIEALHEMGIIHRDIKPANVLIDGKGHTVLADFGLAKPFERYPGEVRKETNPFWTAMSEAPTELPQTTDFFCGTGEYMAPEMFALEQYGYPVDVWAFGVTMFMMLVGHAPWERLCLGDKFQDAVVNEQFKIEEWEKAEYSISFNTILFLRKVLDKEQDTRPTASALKHHSFFKSIDWESIASREGRGPWVPRRRNQLDSPQGSAPVIVSGSSYETGDDPFPHFSYVSPTFTPAALAAPPTSPIAPGSPGSLGAGSTASPHVPINDLLQSPDVPQTPTVCSGSSDASRTIFSEPGSPCQVSMVHALDTAAGVSNGDPAVVECLAPWPSQAGIVGSESQSVVPAFLQASPSALEAMDKLRSLRSGSSAWSIFDRLKTWAARVFGRFAKCFTRVPSLAQSSL